MIFNDFFVVKCKDGRIENIPTFGHQPIVLGGFYSEVENEFLPGLALWTDETVEQYKKTIKHPVQRTLWTNSQSHKEKMEMLNIDISGSIEVDIGTGKKITASGSFLYLDETDVRACSILQFFFNNFQFNS